MVGYFKSSEKLMVCLLSFVKLQREEMILQCSRLCQTTVMQCTKFYFSVYVIVYNKPKLKRKKLFAGEEVVTALGSEVDRLEQEIQELVPGIQHVDIEAHNPIDQTLLSDKLDSIKV